MSPLLRGMVSLGVASKHTTVLPTTSSHVTVAGVLVSHVIAWYRMQEVCWGQCKASYPQRARPLNMDQVLKGAGQLPATGLATEPTNMQLL